MLPFKEKRLMVDLVFDSSAGEEKCEGRGLSCVNLFALESKVSKVEQFPSAVSPKVC